MPFFSVTFLTLFSRSYSAAIRGQARMKKRISARGQESLRFMFMASLF